MTIPRSLALPGPRHKSFVIKIKKVSKKVLDKDSVHADYDQEGQVIRIPRSGSEGERLFYLYHELGHALEDYRLWLLQEL